MSDTLERYLTRCIHFNGVQNKICKLGIAYKDASDGNGYSCIHPEVMTCGKRQFPTREEAQKEADEMDAAVEKAVASIKAGNCPVCGNKPEKKVQVGRCVYAEPCGHRMYQGKA